MVPLALLPMAPLLALFGQAEVPSVARERLIERTYLERFERALEAYDGGDFPLAAELFEAAGRVAQDAPVWRASAGAACARAGDDDAARARFVAALEHGYPVSDLAALDPVGAEVAAGREDADRPDWVTVAARGLRDVHGDHRTARPLALEGSTHLLGLYDLDSVGVRGSYGTWHLERYHVDHWTGRVDQLSVVEKGNFGEDGERYCMPDRVDPWPRAIPFMRALRTGLLVDVPAEPVRAERQFHRGARWARPFDSERLGWTEGNLYVDGSAIAPAGLEVVADPEILRRAAALLPPPGEHEARAVARFAARPGERAERYLVANCWYGGAAYFGSPREPMILLGPDGEEVLGRIENPVRSGVPWGRAAHLFTYDSSRDLILAGFRAGPAMLLAFELGTGEQAWSRPVPVGRKLAIDGGWIFLDGREPSVGQVRDIESGELLLDGSPFGLHRFGLSESGRWVWGMGRDSLALFSVDAIAARAVSPERAPPMPLIQLWNVSDHAVAVGCDGTWSVPRDLFEHDARVLIGETLEPALLYAPWLLDPLHVRTIDGDRDRSPRRFPSSR